MSISLTYTFPANFTYTLPVTGTYTVNWGGGTNLTSTTHKYTTAGPWNIVVTGTGLALNHNGNSAAPYLISCNAWTGVGSSLANAFTGCSALTLVPTTLPSNSITSMSNMFSGASVFNQDISGWTTTTALVNTSNMFYAAVAFNNGATSGAGPAFTWVTSAVTDMSYMFQSAFKFNCPLNFNTQSVTSMNGMFGNASVFNQNVGSWTTTTALVNTSYMFNNASVFNNGTYGAGVTGPAFSSSWVTSAVTDMSYMFSYASRFNCPVNFNTQSVKNMSSMFQYALYFNQNVGSWTTSVLTDISGMFAYAIVFNNGATSGSGPAFSSWVTSAVTNMSGMFQNASRFNCPVNFNTQSVKTMSYMFYNAIVFNQDISGWNTTTALLDTSGMFGIAKAFNNGTGLVFASSWVTSAVTDMSNMFYNASTFNCPVNFNTQSVKNMNAMFQGASVFNQDISAWNTTSALDTSYMFYSASAFNNGATSGAGPAFTWNTFSVTDMSYMFYSASTFNCPVYFNAQSVKNMNAMFQGASVFNQDISALITSSALKNTSNMFYGASVFNNGATGATGVAGPAFTWSWNTSAVTDMSYMFYNASNFNCPLNFNTQNVNDMTGMFQNASVFNQNVGTWNFGAVVINGMTSMFDNCGITQTTYDAMLTSWATQSPINLKNKNPIGVSGLIYTYITIHNTLSTSPYSNTFVGDIEPTTTTTTTLAPTTLAPTTLAPTTLAPIPMPICFLEGTYIYTNHGYELIETLKKGDLINTFKDNYVPIDSIIKETIYHDATQVRNKKQLFHLSFPNYQQLLKDLYLTGAHSVLVGKLTDTQQNALMEEYKGIYVTDLFYRLPVYLDEKASVHPVSGTYTIYHLVLENKNIHFNYGIFANGLLVESLSKNDSLKRIY